MSRSRAALEMVEQPAGRRDQHIDAAGELGILIIEGYAADEKRNVELLAGAVLVETLLHLCRELARGLKDERARHSGTGPSMLQEREHGKREGGGLASACLRDPEHVTACKDVRDGLLLNGGRGLITGRFDRGENLGR